MAKVITITNQKGGVAKTTTTAALAAGLKNRGYKVLAIDLDPQGNLSSSVAVSIYEVSTVHDLMLKRISAKDVVISLPAFDIIPSNIMLAGLEHELVQAGKEYRLEETLKPVMNDYDYIVIDTPPSLGILTTNAIMIADELIIPSTAGIFAATGIDQLKLFIDSLVPYRRRKGELKIAGVLITKYNNRTVISKELKQFTEQIATMLDTKVFSTNIRFSISVEEAQASKKDIFVYSASNVTEDYNLFIDEYLKGNN